MFLCKNFCFSLFQGSFRSFFCPSTFSVNQFPVFIAAGSNEEELAKASAAIKYRLGFYGSTPAYKNVLDTEGWGDLQPTLNRMTKEGHWDKLPEMIPDEMLHAFAAVGSHVEVAQQIADRFGGLIDRCIMDASAGPDVLEQQMSILRTA